MDRLSPTVILGLGLAVASSFTLSACEFELPGQEVSPCHPVRKCITLTCREKLSEGLSSTAWKDCVRWCRESRGIARSEATFCAERIGVTCIRDWYGPACVDARQRCKTGEFRDEQQGGC